MFQGLKKKLEEPKLIMGDIFQTISAANRELRETNSSLAHGFKVSWIIVSQKVHILSLVPVKTPLYSVKLHIRSLAFDFQNIGNVH